MFLSPLERWRSAPFCLIWNSKHGWATRLACCEKRSNWDCIWLARSLRLSISLSLLICSLDELDCRGLLIQGIHAFIIPRSAYLTDLLGLVRWATMKIFCLSINLFTISGKFLIIDRCETTGRIWNPSSAYQWDPHQHHAEYLNDSRLSFPYSCSLCATKNM